MGNADTSFPRLVSLAAHDLRTPLATIHGFAQTLVRMGDLGQPKQRYLEMIDVASRQLAELLDELGLAARIEGGRYEPNLQPADTRGLAFGAAEELGPERVVVEGEGTSVEVDREAGTISWPDGLDMAPEPLYAEARRHPLRAARTTG